MGHSVLFVNYRYPGIVKGFQDLGWQVPESDDINWWRFCHGTDGQTAKHAKDYGDLLKRRIFQVKPSMMILGKGYDSNKSDPQPPGWWYVPPSVLAYARKIGVIVVQLDLDMPNDYGWLTTTTIPDECDAIGTCCMDIADGMTKHTSGQVFEFWPAWDGVERASMPTDEERKKLACDFVLVGSPYTAQADRGDDNPMGPSISRAKIARAAIDVGADLAIYGPKGWLEKGVGDPAFEPYYRGFFPWDKVHHIYASAKVSYNSFVRPGKRYANDRIFMIGGVGGFMLSEAQTMMREEFPEGVVCSWHQRGNVEDFKERLTYWLEHDDEREAAGKAMQKLVLEKHTYAHRAKDIAHVYESAVERRKRRRVGGCCGGGKK